MVPPASTNGDDDDANSGDFLPNDSAAEETEALEEIDVLLDQTRPRHIVAGITSGIGYIVAGAIGACGILVLSPRVGADTGYANAGGGGDDDDDDGNNNNNNSGSRWLGGLVGGLVGTVVGVGSATSVVVGGVFTGVGQMLRGLANTPASLVQPRRGRWWSVYEGRWIKTHLKSDKEWIDAQPVFDEDLLGDEVVPDEVLAERPDQKDKRARALEFSVKETALYDTMGVDPDATEDEIKRRYNQVGKLFSPTRQGADTPASKARYQKIGTAFVILTNKEMRARYDKFGMDGIYGDDGSNHQRDLIDPNKLYQIMYGSDKFHAYIGRLAAASEASVGIQKSSKITLGEARLLQKRRATRLALLLAERLKKWTLEGAQQEARDDWENEARELCDANQGRALLNVIGSAYSLSAAQFLGSFESGIGMPSINKWAKSQYLTLTQTSKTTKKKVENFAGDVKQTRLQHEAKSKIESSVVGGVHGGIYMDDSVTAELFETIGKDVLEMLWARTVVDVTNTIHEAAQMVLFDQDLNVETRKLRGEGLEALGEIFQNANYEQSPEAELEEAEYEKIAFYAVLDTIRKQEVAARNAA